MRAACCICLTDRVKTPCRNGNEQLSNPSALIHDIGLLRSSRRRIYLARAPRVAKFSHSLLNFCVASPAIIAARSRADPAQGPAERPVTVSAKTVPAAHEPLLLGRRQT